MVQAKPESGNCFDLAEYPPPVGVNLFDRCKMNPSAIQTQPLRLSWPMPLAAGVAVLAAMLPLICWFGLADPNLVPGLFHLPWDNSGAMITAVGTVLILFFVPLSWMLV